MYPAHRTRIGTGLALLLGAALSIGHLALPPRADAQIELFRFSHGSLFGAQILPRASLGGGGFLGLDYSGIDILDLGLRARLQVSPLLLDGGWGAPLAASAYLAARIHEPPQIGRIAGFVEIASGVGLAISCSEDLCQGASGPAFYAQGGIEIATSPRFAMTFALELGAIVDVERSGAVLLPVLVVGFRAG